MSVWYGGPLLGFDLETDGVTPTECRPVSFALVWFDRGEVTKSRYGLVNPGRPIPDDTIKIHGITDAMVAEKGGDLEKSIIGIAGYLVEAKHEGRPIVGQNLRFDLTIVDTLYRSFNDGKGLREDNILGNVIDTSVIDRHVDKWRKGSRKLDALCQHYGVQLEGAHNAKVDAEASVRVAIALAEKYPEVGHADIEQLHLMQVGWRRAWLTDFNEYRLQKGEQPIDETEGNWPLHTDERVILT